MPPLLIAATTPDAPGFAALRIESLEQHFNMLRRLAENWQSGKNRFNAPGETLLGAFVNHQLVGVCGINSDPFSPQPRAGPFYERLGFRPVYDEPRVTHRLFCSL